MNTDDHNVLLQVLCHGFTHTVVFHIRGHLNLHFFQYPEIMVNGLFTGKDDTVKLQRIYVLFSEFIYMYTVVRMRSIIM